LTEIEDCRMVLRIMNHVECMIQLIVPSKSWRTTGRCRCPLTDPGARGALSIPGRKGNQSDALRAAEGVGAAIYISSYRRPGGCRSALNGFAIGGSSELLSWQTTPNPSPSYRTVSRSALRASGCRRFRLRGCWRHGLNLSHGVGQLCSPMTGIKR